MVMYQQRDNCNNTAATLLCNVARVRGQTPRGEKKNTKKASNGRRDCCTFSETVLRVSVSVATALPTGASGEKKINRKATTGIKGGIMCWR